MLYYSWDMVHDRCNCCFSFWPIFCPFTSLTAHKNIDFKKMRKNPGDIIILLYCTKNHDYILYCSWDMARDGCNCCFSFWAISSPFTSLAAQKVKISNNEKDTWRYHHFTQVYQKSWSYAMLSLRYGTWHMSLLFFILGNFFSF